MGDRVAVLRFGKLQQFASPNELYDRPANAFVAGFTLVFTILAGALIVVGEWFAAGLAVFVASLADVFDGSVARHRGEAKRESEGIISAARLEAREITDKARAEAAAMKATAP